MSKPMKTAADFWKANTGGDWYAVKISKARCVRCSMSATHTVYNSANASVADYCRRHAAQAIKEKRL